MKKVLDSKLFLVIITAVICISTTAYATLTYSASQIMYTKSNNQEVTLDTALNELYTSANEEAINKIDGTVSSSYYISKDTSADDTLTLPLSAGNYYIFVSMTRGWITATPTDNSEGYHEYPGTNHFTYTNGTCELKDGNTIYSSSEVANNSRYAHVNERSLVYKCRMNANSSVSFNSKATANTSAPQIYSIYALKI